MLASLIFLAASGPSSEFTGNTVLTLIGLGTGIAAIASVFISARRQPPVMEQMHKEFATKEELDVVRTEAAESIRQLHARINTLISGNDVFFRESERSRGHMLAKLEDMEASVKDLGTWLRERL